MLREVLIDPSVEFDDLEKSVSDGLREIPAREGHGWYLRLCMICGVPVAAAMVVLSQVPADGVMADGWCEECAEGMMGRFEE